MYLLSSSYQAIRYTRSDLFVNIKKDIGIHNFQFFFINNNFVFFYFTKVGTGNKKFVLFTYSALRCVDSDDFGGNCFQNLIKF